MRMLVVLQIGGVSWGLRTVLVCLGCNGIALSSSGDDRESPSSGLRSMRQAFVSDVPVPEGFTIEDNMSEDYATPGWRFVRYTFRGNADRRAVLSFYREQMQLNNWTYISRQGTKGRYTLRFEKTNEVCEVEIQPSGGRVGAAGTQVRIEIKPLRRSGSMQGETVNRPDAQE